MSCPPLPPRDPDLSVFYSANDSRKNQRIIQGDKIFTYALQSNISSNIELNDTIGYVRYIGTSSVIDDTVEDAFQLNISLPEGDIIASFTIKDTSYEDSSRFKPNRTYYIPIMAGTGNFAFAMGWIVLNTLENYKRAIYIYFDPACSPMPM